MTSKKLSTLNDCRPSPVLCSERGWKAGTRLIGDEGYGPTIIELTAIGEGTILAKTISHNGVPSSASEHCWTLSCRDWHEVPVEHIYFVEPKD